MVSGWRDRVYGLGLLKPRRPAAINPLKLKGTQELYRDI